MNFQDEYNYFLKLTKYYLKCFKKQILKKEKRKIIL